MPEKNDTTNQREILFVKLWVGQKSIISYRKLNNTSKNKP